MPIPKPTFFPPPMRKRDARPTVSGLTPSYRHAYYARLLKVMWKHLPWSTVNAVLGDDHQGHGWKAFRLRASAVGLLEHLAANHRGLEGLDADVALNEVANALFAAGLEALLTDPAWSKALHPLPAHLEHATRPRPSQETRR